MRTRIVQLAEGRFASYRGAHMTAKGPLSRVLRVRSGYLPELTRLPSYREYARPIR